MDKSVAIEVLRKHMPEIRRVIAIANQGFRQQLPLSTFGQSNASFMFVVRAFQSKSSVDVTAISSEDFESFFQAIAVLANEVREEATLFLVVRGESNLLKAFYSKQDAKKFLGDKLMEEIASRDVDSDFKEMVGDKIRLAIYDRDFAGACEHWEKFWDDSPDMWFKIEEVPLAG